MYTELLKTKLFEQSETYQAVKNGDTSSIQYNGYYDERWGTRDVNYLNRMRMAYYLLYANVDDEDLIVYLFQEELKDRKSNSFQGIGNTLKVLNSILNRYNADGRYDKMQEEAKKANFDCACGFDKNYHMDNKISSLALMDCIVLSQDLEYKDVMNVLVNQWRDNITEWTDTDRTKLTRFNSFLGKEQENEQIYKVLLENAISSGKVFDIVSTYNNVIQYYIAIKRFEIADSYFREMIDTTDFKEIERIRLFGDVLEECFEMICGGVKDSVDLWKWAKPYMQKRTNKYGNLYKKGIEAAKCIDDSYAVQLEQEYTDWKNKVFG